MSFLDIIILFFCYIAEGIDKTLLKSLTPDLIKGLIPNIGLRMRFTMKWKENFGIPNNVTIFFINYEVFML